MHRSARLPIWVHRSARLPIWVHRGIGHRILPRTMLQVLERVEKDNLGHIPRLELCEHVPSSKVCKTGAPEEEVFQSGQASKRRDLRAFGRVEQTRCKIKRAALWQQLHNIENGG